jgi:hypothetical protein
MKRTIVIIALLIICVMLGSIALFHRSKPDTQKLKADKNKIVQDQQQVNLIDKNYNQSLTLLKQSADSLQEELNQTQWKLKIAKVKLNQSEIAVIHLAKKDTAHETVKEQLTDCDSLKQQVLAFTDIMDSTRSIYECNLQQLQNTVAVRDSEIVVCNSSYLQMKNLMEENLQRERQLTDELQTAYKQQRKKALHNKLLAGGFLILSGIAATLFLNAQK